MMAAGASSNRKSSRIISDPVLEPLPKGKTRTFPEIDSPKSSCRLSEILPVVGSTHPQKLIGCRVDNILPLLIPGNIQVPAISIEFPSLALRTRRFQHNPWFPKKSR
jgi:hypothetical protein